jgi:hypothetical protein
MKVAGSGSFKYSVSPVNQIMFLSYIYYMLWVILSCMEGWGKDIYLTLGEFNEMHMNALYG